MTADPSLLARAWRRWVLLPLGYGRPASPATMDAEFAGGAWDHFGSERELPRYRAVAARILDFAGRPTVLDVGCGDAQLARLLPAEKIARYTGVDFSREGLQRARSRGWEHASFVQADFERWSPAARADFVILGECIGYAHDPARLVARALDWVNPGGQLIVTLYRSETWAARWRRVDRIGTAAFVATITNDCGQTWDLRVYQPQSP